MSVGGRKFFVNLALAVCLAVLCGASAPVHAEAVLPGKSVLPAKILSGYFGFWVDRESEIPIDTYADLMEKSGFNAVQIKIQPTNLDLSKTDQMNRLSHAVNAFRSRNMVMLAYVYPNPYDGTRNDKLDGDLPPFVGADGQVVANRFSLIHWPTWRKIFNNAFELARASRDLPISGVLFDLETLHNDGISYDDAAWRSFVLLHKELNADTPAKQRLAALTATKLDRAYVDWFRSELLSVAHRLERELHAENSSLVLGMMPASENPFYTPFITALATAQTPAIMDNWCMYNASGYDKEVLKEQQRIKSANANNLFIPWLRVNNYRPADVTVQGYHAIKNTDGYSSWSLGMLVPGKGPIPMMYQLPADYKPADYWQAYQRANEQVRQDLASGVTAASGIPFEPMRPLLPVLKYEDIKVPDLRPSGDGKGVPQWLSLRDQQTLYFYAQAGEAIRIDARHLAGNRRPIPLHYVIMDSANKVLRHESIAPGDLEKISITAPHSGTYALVISGGPGGLAWYGVRIYNTHMAMQSPATFFYTNDFDVYLPPLKQSAKIHLTMGGKQCAEFKLNGQPAVILSHNGVLELPAGQPIRLHIAKPATMPSGFYTQDMALRFTGGALYLSDGAERLLIPAEEK